MTKVELKAKIKSLESEKAEYKQFLSSRDERIKELSKDKQLLQEQSSRFAKRIIQLETRLDACLYSMVLMQGIIRQEDAKQAKIEHNRYSKFIDGKTEWEEVSLAT